MNCGCALAAVAYTLLGIAVLTVLISVGGCARNVQYRTDSTTPFTGTTNQAATDPQNHAIIEKTPDYTLGFVEFDEEGWFWSPKQVETVKDMVRTEANTSGTNNPAGIILLVFVHGWKNNAAYNCGNVATFRTALTQLNFAEQTDANTNHRTARKIVGVYCGWRGLTWTVPYIQDVTFWARKTTAHRVGGYGAMTELFVELQKLEELSNSTLASNAPPTDFIIVGHSFGGAAVYTAISEFVTKQFVDSLEQTPPRPLKPLGDQVILLNPAFEASRHYNLNRLATNMAIYPTNQRPVLSIFTSKGDWATHYALPAGRFVSTMFENFHGPDQRQATRDAVGWFKPFVTHTLDYNTNAVLGGTATNTTYNRETKQHELDKDSARIERSIKHIHDLRDHWIPNQPGQSYEFDDCILKPHPHYKTGDPFLVVAVDKKIMKDHDDIDNPILINFLREYIQFCRVGSTNTVAQK